MQDVLCISEAFSMQPKNLHVGDEVNGHIINKIVEENIHIEGDPFAYYVGYNPEGQKIFEFRKGTVNVFYK